MFYKSGEIVSGVYLCNLRRSAIHTKKRGTAVPHKTKNS